MNELSELSELTKLRSQSDQSDQFAQIVLNLSLGGSERTGCPVLGLDKFPPALGLRSVTISD